MHSTNYFNTLILASPDSAADAGCVPAKSGTIAAMQYELLSASPYRMTSDDLLLAVEARRRDVKGTKLAELKKSFFSQPRACLRGSPMVKTYGWGIHHDAAGRIALVGRDKGRYKALVDDSDVKKVAGMRARRM